MGFVMCLKRGCRLVFIGVVWRFLFCGVFLCFFFLVSLLDDVGL